jgi:hypothetical protein
MIGNVNWAEVAVQIAITLALTNFIKTVIPKDIGNFAMLVSMGVAFIVVFLATFPNIVAVEFVKQSVIVGLASCGLYDLRQGYIK